MTGAWWVAAVRLDPGSESAPGREVGQTGVTGFGRQRVWQQGGEGGAELQELLLVQGVPELRLQLEQGEPGPRQDEGVEQSGAQRPAPAGSTHQQGCVLAH